MFEENDDEAAGKLLDQLLLGSDLTGPKIIDHGELATRTAPNLSHSDIYDLIINTFGIPHVDTETNTVMGDPSILENSEAMSKPKRSFSEQ